MIIQPNSLDIIKRYDSNTRFYQTSWIVTKIWSATTDLLGKIFILNFLNQYWVLILIFNID